MSDRRDQLKESQGQGSQRLKLPVIKAYEAKNSDGPAFKSWNKDKGEHGEQEVYLKPISGIYIGSAQVASAFDDNLGRNGGSYNSAFYFTNDNLALFDPQGKIVVSGTKEEVKTWCSQNTTEGKLSVKKVLFLLTAGGLISVKTNITLFIDNVGTFEKDTFIDYLMKVTPAMYDPDSKEIGKKAHEFLGKFAKRNPPCYALITQGEAITDEMWDKWGASEVVDTFQQYKEERTAGKKAEASSEQETVENAGEGPRNDIPAHTEADIPPEAPEDDLPF